MQDANYGLTLGMIKTIKAPFFIALVCMGLLAACNSQPNVDLADNALDGGRYFIENCMQGDFKKAKNYLVESPQNEAIFDTLSAHYYLLDKEGRQQLRQASIQINEVSSIDATHSIIDYQNSFDKIPMKMSVIATPKGWKVDLQYSYPQKEK
ncbi:MAG: hypothetical protein NTY43_04540 [Bacteroidetes bacterium]|jgi:hypothetical protein|nr:hypothetical protein [Bacteroidota bacterium]